MSDDPQDVNDVTTATTQDPTDAADETAVPGPRHHGPQVQTRPTVRLDPRDLRPSWPIVIAYLEQIAPWPVLALRLGTLALIQNCVRELAEADARADLVVKLRDLVEALAHMPLEA